MLTIKNIDKIVGMQIHNHWYIKNMQGMVSVMDLNGTHNELYQIVIWNEVSGDKRRMHLFRDKIQEDNLLWYKLSYMQSDGVEQIQYISSNALKDMDRLIECIKSNDKRIK